MIIATHEYQDPLFWADWLIAVGTIGAAGVAAWLGVKTIRDQNRRDEKATEADRRQVTVVVQQHESQGFWGSVDIVNASANLITDVRLRIVCKDYQWVWDRQAGIPPLYLPPGQAWSSRGGWHPTGIDVAEPATCVLPELQDVGWYLRWRDPHRNIVARDHTSPDPVVYPDSASRTVAPDP